MINARTHQRFVAQRQKGPAPEADEVRSGCHGLARQVGQEGEDIRCSITLIQKDQDLRFDDFKVLSIGRWHAWGG